MDASRAKDSVVSTVVTPEYVLTQPNQHENPRVPTADQLLFISAYLRG